MHERGEGEVWTRRKGEARERRGRVERGSFIGVLKHKLQDAHQILSVSEKFCGYVQIIVYLLGLPNFDYWKGNDPLAALRDIMGIMKVRFKLLVQVLAFLPLPLFLFYYFITNCNMCTDSGGSCLYF